MAEPTSVPELGAALSEMPEEYYAEECMYLGTEYLHIKIWLVGVFGTSVAALNILFNAFFTLVFVSNQQLRRSPLYYFGILAILDIILAVNYILLMSVPVYMDQFEQLWLYHIFLTYLTPMMTLSNCAMFGSMLLIFMATVERLLRTFRSENLAVFRKGLEQRRPLVCFCCVLVAFLYKLCTYFELHYIENVNCTDWSQYEIISTSLAMHPGYRFWWMFVTRNLVDRIIPFFILVLLNFLIIRTLKREHQRFSVVEHRLMNTTEVVNKKMLRQSTRALIALVSLYLLGQTLQVVTTFIEAFHRSALETHYSELYSYLNDIMSLMTLLSSTLRFPVYCSCNQEIYEASRSTVAHVRSLCVDSKSRSADYLPITIGLGPKEFKAPIEAQPTAIHDVSGSIEIDGEESPTWVL